MPEVEVTIETKNIDDEKEQDEMISGEWVPNLIKIEVHVDDEEREEEMAEQDWEGGLQREFRSEVEKLRLGILQLIDELKKMK